MLEVKGLCAGYGGGAVVQGIDLTLEPGRILALVGANGAGKSTLVKAVSGLLRPQAGRVLLDGVDIGHRSTRQRVQLGIAHVPEGRQVFAGLSVEENLRLGAWVGHRRLGEAGMQKRIAEVCETFPVLSERRRQPAGTLSGGQQQMLAIARGLMAQPRYLLLDEPSLGLSPTLVAEIFRLIGKLRAAGIGILLAEQNARMSLAIADRACVVENGRAALQGTGKELLAHSDVADRYLGVGKAVGAAGDDRHARLVAELRALSAEAGR
jgi:branched-chain amino acid transport system ATP-binding protein